MWHKKPVSNKVSKNKFSYRDNSVIKKLRKENKSNPKFEILVNNLTLEELIALKLELAYRATCSRLFYLPLLETAAKIMSAAVIKFAISVSNSKREAAAILRKDTITIAQEANKLGVFSYFKKGTDNNDE